LHLVLSRATIVIIRATMSSLTRFGVSIDSALIRRFDRFLRAHGYPNRSEAFRDLVRTRLVDDEARDDFAHALGVLTLVYDHHKRDLATRLGRVQHDHHASVISTTHVHITHDSCLEVVLLRGHAGELRSLAAAIATLKGIHHSKLILTSIEERDHEAHAHHSRQHHPAHDGRGRQPRRRSRRAL
jgi:CopG family nickel-responsive transcriptional regulator